MQLGKRFAVCISVAIAAACGGSQRSPAPRENGQQPPPVEGGSRAPVIARAECDLPDLATSSPVIYVCDCDTDADSGCAPGDDANSGMSKDEPRRSYAAARTAFAELPAGGVVALCRGGAFRAASGADPTRWLNSGCSASERCVVRDYDPPWASATLAAPIVWVDGDDAFRFDDAGPPAHEEGYIVANVDVRCAQDSGTTGFYFYNDIDDVLLCGVGVSGCEFGVHVSGSNPIAEEDSDGRNERIVLRSARIVDNRTQGWLGGCDGCAIEYSYFDNNGYGETVRNHNIYLSDPGKYLKRGERIVGNELYRSSIVDGVCSGVSLVVHGEHEDLLIEDNLVREDVGAADSRCWGISVDTGYSEDPEAFTGVAIRRNRVLNVGRVSIGLNACRDCTIENNVVVQEQEAFNGVGISVPVRDRGDNDQSGTQVVVRNNSILMKGAANAGIQLGEEGMGHKAVSNAIQYLGTGRFDCFVYSAPADAYDVVDNNLCDAPNAQEMSWEDAFPSLADWRSTSGFDTASRAEDPRFRSIAGPDYDLAADMGSPMIDSGHPTESSANDFSGKARDASPDIGAQEL